MLGHHGASVSGGSVWLLRVADRPAAVITRASAGGPGPGAGRPSRGEILVSSVLLVGRTGVPLPAETTAHQEYRHREDPFTLVRAARDGALG